MIERGLYFAKAAFKALVRSVGGEWNDTKERPMVCLVQVKGIEGMYWAIPMGNMDHRTNEQKKRIEWFMSLPVRDIRSCYYHVAKTTETSIFFISDAVPITEAYIERAYLYNNTPYVIKNKDTIAELERKLSRILSVERRNPNHFRQRITDVKERLRSEIGIDDTQNHNQ